QGWEDATLILLLLSPDYLATDTCYQEMLDALERQQRGEVRVLPILLRPCDRSAPPLATVSCLPSNGQAVTSWADQDAAFHDIVQDIRQTLDLPYASPRSTREQKNRALLLKRVHKNWIDGVFVPSLREVTRLTLSLQERPDALVHPGWPQMQEFD